MEMFHILLFSRVIFSCGPANRWQEEGGFVMHDSPWPASFSALFYFGPGLYMHFKLDLSRVHAKESTRYYRSTISVYTHIPGHRHTLILCPIHTLLYPSLMFREIAVNSDKLEIQSSLSTVVILLISMCRQQRPSAFPPAFLPLMMY